MTNSPNSSNATDGEHQSPATAAGHDVIEAAERFGVKHLFTLSGAHIFPLYDGCHQRESAPRLVDTRHEQTAGFAAEATARLTRTPGFVAATAGPGVTNLLTPITSAFYNGAPLVAIGGRAPDYRWGSGALQELDQPPIFSTVTKKAVTLHDPQLVGAQTAELFALSLSNHNGPTFADIPMDVLYTPTTAEHDYSQTPQRLSPNVDSLEQICEILHSTNRPVVIAGTDIWQTRAENQFREFVEHTQFPVIVNGMSRGVLPSSNPLLVTPARSYALKNADVIVVAGTPLDFRISYGDFPNAHVVYLTDDPESSRHSSALRLTGDLAQIFALLTHQVSMHPRTERDAWLKDLRDHTLAARAANANMMATESDTIHPARIYGELLPRLTDDTITIGDGGDFVSYAGKFIEPTRPGRWLDPGPFGALGTAMGYTLAAGLAFPDDPIVVLLGDGAAGFSLMDVDSLVRHNIPATIVVGNNSGWGLERHPMRFLYGYDVLADLEPSRYDLVVQALGGAGETVTTNADIAPALDRAMNSGVPYLVNIMTDPEVAYPRSTTGV